MRFLLEEDVYHHLHLAAGLPYAISTMLHYVILLIGFFVALGALGIDLTKVTILGAFSVGIGFGLQNVINNFVSGLILLFERPIKVGDVIEVGGNVGEVTRIGIRASCRFQLIRRPFAGNFTSRWSDRDRDRAVGVDPVPWLACGARPGAQASPGSRIRLGGAGRTTSCSGAASFSVGSSGGSMSC